MYFKIEAIKIKITLEKIYHKLNHGETLTNIYKEVSTGLKAYLDEDDPSVIIPEEFIVGEGEFVFDL